MEQTNSAGHSAKKASILNCLVAIFCFNFILFTFYCCKPLVTLCVSWLNLLL